MWGASRGVLGTTRLRSTWPPAPAAHGGGEPSLEEQAFARDAAGHLGGCVWPPRSYTCSFCRREFRSAQALGGHMNVHRRDRARLRQCTSPDHDAVQDTQQQQPSLQPDQHLQADSPSLYSSPCPKSSGDLSLNKDLVMISSSTSPSYISTIIKESKNKVFISMPTSTVREAAESDDEEEMRKRRRVDQSPEVVLPFFVRPSASCERVDRDAKVTKVIASPSSTSLQLVGRQGVDLELRLGRSSSIA